MMGRPCPWCGLETSDIHQCEWCGKALGPVAPDPLPQGGPDPVDDVSDEDDAALSPLPPFGIRLEWFLGLAMPLLAASMAFGHFVQGPVFGIIAGTSFCLGFVASACQLVQSVDEHWAAVGFAVVFAILLGPVAVLVIFLALLVVTRREECWTIVALLGAHLAAAIAVAYAASPELRVALPMAGVASGASVPGLSVLAVVAGWILANFWRPLDE